MKEATADNRAYLASCLRHFVKEMKRKKIIAAVEIFVLSTTGMPPILEAVAQFKIPAKRSSGRAL